MGDLQGRRSLPQILKFMSIDVGRGSATHDIALARACELKKDVLLIQEPWWSQRTKSHPFFDRHVLFGGPDVQPRAVTYTRKNSREIRAIQKSPESSATGDYCWVVFNEVIFLNLYKAPHDTKAALPLLDLILSPRLVIASDFNAVYWAWQSGCYEYKVMRKSITTFCWRI